MDFNLSNLFPITMNLSFPEELILEIFLRIPAKDLIRFKIVCKPWYSLINDPKFAKAHLNRSNPQIIFETLKDDDYEYNYDYFSIDIQEKNMQTPIEGGSKEKFILYDSCNGLLLLQYISKQGILSIHNSVTREFKDLPPTKDYIKVYWALVYDDSIDKYKVFGIVSQNTCIVFTQGGVTSGDWIEFETSVPTPDQLFTVSSDLVFDRKELNWLSVDDDDVDDDDGVNVAKLPFRLAYYIFSVDVSKHKFRKTKVPSCQANANQGEQTSTFNLSEVKGSLCFISLSEDHFDVWVLNDRVNCLWSKYCNITLQSISNEVVPLESFWSSETRIVFMRYIDSSSFKDIIKIIRHHEDQLSLYDLKSQEWRQVAILSKEQTLWKSYFYFNSLVRWE